jgi:chitodextrinase
MSSKAQGVDGCVGRRRFLSPIRLIPLLSFSVLALALGPMSVASNVVYTYDSNGRLKQLTYDNGVVVVYSYDANGNRENAQVIAPALETPTNLVATPVSESEIDLSWTGSSGAGGYYIYRCAGAGCTPTQQFTSPGSGTTYQDTGLAPSTTYVYAVQAYQVTNGSTITSKTSVTATAETDRDSTPPTAPTNLTATASASSISLSWGASTDNVAVQGYELQRCEGAGCTGFQTVNSDIAGTSYTDPGLTQDATYQYRVFAFDAAGNDSGYSNTASATIPDTTAPTVPQGLTATAVSWSTVDLAWSASTDDVSVAGYRVYRNGSQIGSSATTSYTDTTTLPGTSYSYTVSAYDPAGNSSAQSGAASVTTPAAPPPSTPGGLSATVAGDDLIDLSWSAAGDAGGPGIGGYKIYRNGTEIGTSSSTSFSDSGVTPFHTYSYSVAAYDAAGTTSGQSSAASASTFYQITDSSGTVLPAASSLYLSENAGFYVKPSHEWEWLLQQNYGSKSVVLRTAPEVPSPPCSYGSTQMIASGYARSGCVVYAAPSAYGH